jgi:hypothetical protein
MSVYVPGHAKRPHDWFDKARAWLSAHLPRRQWTELDEDDAWPPDDDEFCPSCGWPDTSAGPCETCGYDQFADVLIDPDCRDGKHQSCVGGPCECDCHEDVPRPRPETGTGGRAEPERETAPGYHHHDAPAQVVPAVRLDDGSYAGLSGTIPANLPRPEVDREGARYGGEPGHAGSVWPGQPHRWPRPYPHAGPPAWHPARPPLQPWIQAILGCADSDAWELRWRWAWQQQRRLAIR